MALTQLVDIVEPEVWLDYQSENTPENNLFFTSGIVVEVPLLASAATAGGRTTSVPFWKDLDQDDEANISSDDPNAIATAAKIQAGKQVAQTSYLNKVWSAADLASEIAGSDAMDRIADRTEKYFTGQWSRRLTATIAGVMADNVANDAGDMINDIAIEDGDNATAANLFSRAAYTKALFTLGDGFKSIAASGLHSVVYNRLVDNDDIDFIPDSAGVLSATYLGALVIVDDQMTVVAGGTSGFKYTTVLFGAGAFGSGMGEPRVPVEVERESRAGNGGGVEFLTVRKQYILHPFGFAFLAASVAGESPSIAELKLAANWDRVFDRKNVPLAFLVTNG